MVSHYRRIIKDAEKKALLHIKNQVLDKTSPYYGGVISYNNLADPRTNVFILAEFIELYLNEDSSYYSDPLLYERILLLTNYIKRVQRPDGTFDLSSCNFYSAPDTAFAINAIIPSYRVLERLSKQSNPRNEITKLFEEIQGIIKRAGYGIARGGFHTPNHRWAIAACLMSLYNIFKIEEFRERAYKYLNEGIDCNEYGEYAERSSGNYNHVNNEQMIILAKETGDPSYLEYVRRNLDMMINYFEPDGTIFTGNSTRQDRGKKVYPDIYYNQYLYMAYKLDNPLYGAIANWIMDGIIQRGATTPNFLGFFNAHPELINYELPSPSVPNEYKVYYPESGIVRFKRNNISFTIVKDSSYFLYFQVGEIKAKSRIFARYFDKRLFIPQKIRETAGGYIISYTAQGWYYLPFDEKPETSDWWKMDNSKRAIKEGPDLNITVTIKEIDDGISVKIAADGCDGVPVFFEMCFENDVIVEGDGFMLSGAKNNSITVKSGEVKITKGIDTMVIGPGFGEVLVAEQQLEEIGENIGGFSVYFSDVSNFEHTIMMRDQNKLL